jgi:hypothetical protein
MATLNDRVFDNGLTVLDTEANAVHVTSQEATTYTSATSTHTLGNSTSLSIGSVSGTGTATHYALVDTSNTRLLATGALTASQSVTNGNTFTLAAFDIGIPDPA